ncbi:F-box/kelch-repeat protein SKIP25 [Capsicum baccatum]|uniref:F-box/kelch-repeat protein SKIP25 n=1 Tax=Capsicum baccatum TaxID=33114 RepID=A0A2G2XM52_CAPBA|nr:F-box/kelch-repeat protein SKIP25 [Capsicum baccatum]
MNNSTTVTISAAASAAGAAIKRRKKLHQYQSLIPGLPDDIAQICLSHVQPSTLYSVCHSWRRLVYSSSFPSFLSVYSLLKPSQSEKNSVDFANFDPVSAKWTLLPPPPLNPPLRILLRHPSFISRHLPIQSVSVSGNFVLLAATTDPLLPALSNPLVFNPRTGKWSNGPQLATPRRWCAAGASHGVVYVASGVGSHYNPEVARSVEKWDMNRNNRNHLWEKMNCLKDGKFSREAIEAVGWRGKLCMVNVKGDAAKEGIIYDVESDSWQEMPEGMLMGWRGPAAAMEEEIIYTVDESKGALRKYDHRRDCWLDILENEMLKGARHMAAAGGRVCVVSGGGEGIVVVDVVAELPRLVVVETPVGFQVLDVHILPRISQLDSELHYEI